MARYYDDHLLLIKEHGTPLAWDTPVYTFGLKVIFHMNSTITFPTRPLALLSTAVVCADYSCFKETT